MPCPPLQHGERNASRRVLVFDPGHSEPITVRSARWGLTTRLLPEPNPLLGAMAAPPPPLPPTPLQEALKRANHELLRSGTSWRIERRGQRLGLRGPLPPRGGDGQGPTSNQRLSLGLMASEAAVAEALAVLQQVQEQLRLGTFRWTDWQRHPSRIASPTHVEGSQLPSARAGAPVHALGEPDEHALSPLKKALASFQHAFHQDPRRRRSPAGARSTWRAAYQPYLRRLQAMGAQGASELTSDLLMAVLESYPVASRSRQQCALVLAALARHQGLPLPPDWLELGRGYGLHLARFRPLPSDAQILQAVQQIPNHHWRLVYGLMATYGLRNHEVFFCDFSALAPGGDRVLRVLPTSKTGEHQVWPFQPEWVETFGLEQLGLDPGALPRLTTDLRKTTLQRVGQRVSEQFRRYALPLTPYDLRHAWAVRTIHIGLPDTVASRMMGHSVAIHTRTYHHWITRRDQQQAVDAALARRQAS